MKKAILGALFAGAMLVSCSDDSIINEGPGDVTEGEGRYITFNIVTPASTPGSRGTSVSPNEFEDGQGFENKAEKAVFLFFDENGNSTQFPQTATLSWTDKGNDNHVALDNISTTTVVIAGNTKPTQVIAVLNPPTNISFVNGQTLSGVRGRINDYSLTGTGDDRRILMSNSVYVNNGKEICAADITGKTYLTADSAMNNAVDIYVERVLAKVRTKETPAKDKTFAQEDSVTIDGVKTIFKPEVIGIEIANIANHTKLLKSIEGWNTDKWSNTWKAWNDSLNKRSYWANTNESNIGFTNQSWNKINEKKDGKVIFNPAEEQEFYIHPNTSATKSSVLITAVLKTQDGDTLKNVLYWAGNYYKQGLTNEQIDTVSNVKYYEGFLNQYATLIQNENYRMLHLNDKSEKVIETIPVTYLHWLTDKGHETLAALEDDKDKFKGYEATALLQKIKLPNGYSIVKLTGEIKDNAPVYTESSVDKVNEFLKDKKNRVWLWKDGKCYYFANIEHFGPANTMFSEGVVRNHIYDLSLESVKGLGVPVFNPEEIIIPEKPDDKLYYLAARINILKWRLVKQTVNFN